MPRALKGGKFERLIAKQLSMWWSGGIRDDIFWRSSQSGGRATQRLKSGKKTYGSYGDIAALDPIGEPLMKFATIELKCGFTHGSAWEVFEALPTKKNAKKFPQSNFEKAITQARRSAEQAGSHGWLLIVKRDRKRPIIYVDRQLHMRLGIPVTPFANFNMSIRQTDGPFRIRYKFTAFILDKWLRAINPQQIISSL